MDIISRNRALAGLLDAHLKTLAASEALPEAQILDAIRAGRMVLLANPGHTGVRPTLIGQPARVKINANIGTSKLLNRPDLEKAKLAEAERAGADAVMDLSTAGDLDAIRLDMLASCPLPLGTVPIYAAAQERIDAGLDPAGMDADAVIEEIAKQAKQGVDFMTVHCGVTRQAVELAQSRVCGVVSRGGALLGRWMRENGRENPLLTRFDDILDISREHNLTLSLGDGLRPGAGADAGDAAQWEEVAVLGQLQARALKAGVQVMIEGPGHVPLHLVAGQMQMCKRLTNHAPLYVLGPLVTDSAAGYDHIAGAIGGTLGVMHGVDFLCYLTPAEHLTLPCVDDVRQGVMASRVAAQAGEVALGRPLAVARDLAMSKARKALDWDGMAQYALDPETVRARRKEHAHEKECAMCGKYCAMKML